MQPLPAFQAIDDVDAMQDTFFFQILPGPLKRALRDMPGATLLQHLVRGGLVGGDDIFGTVEASELSKALIARKTAESFLAAISPLAQDRMESMNARDRSTVMEWLSLPEPIAVQMEQLVEMLLSDEEKAKEVAEAALQMVSGVEELQGVLNITSQQQVLTELDQLREACAEEDDEKRAEQERQACAIRTVSEGFAADAVATAHNALLPHVPSCKGSAGPSSAATSFSSAASSSSSKAPRVGSTVDPPSASAPSTDPGATSRRASGRLALRRKCDPLAVMPDDAILSAFLCLETADLERLVLVSHAWRTCVRRTIHSAAWRAEYGCVAPGSLCKIVTASGMGRLAVGRKGYEPSGLVNQPWPVYSAHKKGRCETFVLKRLDHGTSRGPLSTHHSIGIVCSAGCHRIDLGLRPLKPALPKEECTETQLRLVRPLPQPAAAAATSASGAKADAPQGSAVLCYGDEVWIDSKDKSTRFFYHRAGGVVHFPLDLPVGRPYTGPTGAQQVSTSARSSWSSTLRIEQIADVLETPTLQHPVEK